LIFKNKTLVACLPANIEQQVLYSHQGLTYGGFIYKADLKFHVLVEVVKSVLLFLKKNNIQELVLKALPAIYLNYRINNALDYLMFKLKAEVFRTDVLSVIDLKANTTYSRDRKAGIKRGLRHGVTVKEEATFEAFWNTILIPNLKSKHNVKPVHSLEEISYLKGLFPNQIRQFNVYQKDSIVAGTTIFETKNVAHSQYISANDSKNKLGSLDVLHDHLLKNIFKDKPFFDFGISNINKGQHINEGLLYWKEGFGARAVPQSFFKINTANGSFLNEVFV